MPDQTLAPMRARAERWFSVAVATRVNSVLSVFFEKLSSQEDSFAAVQVVESAWREAAGQGEEAGFQLESIPLLERLKGKAISLDNPAGAAVAAAADAALLISSYHRDDNPRVAEVMASALTVALEFDRHGIAAPEGYASWLSFESLGHADLANLVFGDEARLDPGDSFEIRFKSGEDSMTYRNSIKAWLRDVR
ncbi:hypothetical protein SY2F82_74550 [Streptomyces sp. Y2F8-2]|uniref:hypothetical protein n=1 Tax=Streptomyces sp. Y2F8-2 TaxID=2759675 RepID=UPI0019041BCF|nr:hypothetical protein [Streptomyces sp. Y2F8-2]GHK05658.1 hypothetical protein SY2F82_74550 [Streptomyces sp. Y2F8-2]